VLDSWVSFFRFCPRKSTSPPGPGGLPVPSLGRKLLWLAQASVARYQEGIANARFSNETADFDKIMLDTSIAFEYENNKTDDEWSLRTGGLSKINDDFFYLEAYFQCSGGPRFASICERWAPLIIGNDEREAFLTEEHVEKFRAFFLPFWSFFVALYHALQRAENELTAMDAFWLGLIDTLRLEPTASRAAYYAKRGGGTP
jgi:hypothetical protein